jgi:DNA-binding NarL/FixJ family response regulator
MTSMVRIWVVQEDTLFISVVLRLAARVAESRHLPKHMSLPAEAGNVQVVIVPPNRARAMADLRPADSGVRLLVTADDALDAQEALDTGAEGVVDADSVTEDLPIAIDALLAGKRFLSPALASRMYR